MPFPDEAFANQVRVLPHQDQWAAEGADRVARLRLILPNAVAVNTRQAEVGSGWSTISGDGCVITYNSNTSTQLDEDTNDQYDVFLYRR
jgi:hypothetical protein